MNTKLSILSSFLTEGCNLFTFREIPIEAVTIEPHHQIMELKINELINNKPFIIAEISANHKQDISLAKKLIDLASECGSNAVKFQTFRPDSLTLNSNSKELQTEESAEVKQTQSEHCENDKVSHDHHDIDELWKLTQKVVSEHGYLIPWQLQCNRIPNSISQFKKQKRKSFFCENVPSSHIITSFI